MNCPRCGGSIESFQLGDARSQVCQDCEYVGIPTDHGAERSSSESWSDALERFRAETLAGQASPDVEAATESDRLAQNLELPGSGQTLSRRKDAVMYMYEKLQHRQRATRTELLTGIDPDPLEYAHLDSFWSNAGRRGLRALPGVSPPENGETEWRFEGERTNGNGA